MIAGLERKIRGDLYDENDFFPADRVAERMNTLREWLKTIGAKDFDRVSLDTRALTKVFLSIP